MKHVCWLENRDSQSRRFAPYFSDQIAYPLSFNALYLDIMPTLTHILFRRPSSFQKRGQLPRAPKARIAGVPVLRNKIGVKNITDFGKFNLRLSFYISTANQCIYVSLP